jgi:hypothetical protein
MAPQRELSDLPDSDFHAFRAHVIFQMETV